MNIVRRKMPRVRASVVVALMLVGPATAVGTTAVAAGAVPADPTYGVTAEAVCIDGVPQASFSLAGTGAVIVTFGGVPHQIQQESPSWRTSWPSAGATFVPEVAWSAVVAGESGVPVSSGMLPVPSGCQVTLPGPPTGLTVTAGNGHADLSWSAPANDGGSPIIDYVVQRAGGTRWETVNDAVSTTTSAQVSGLTNDVLYIFRVLAVNAAGAGDGSNSVNVTPVAPPPPPATYGVRVSVDCVNDLPTASFELDGSGAVIVTFAGASRQIQQGSPSWSASWPWAGDAFVPAVPWTAVVAGESGTPVDGGTLSVPADCPPPAPVVAPGAPGGLAATAGDGAVDLTWSPPADDGGGAITDYAVEHSADGGASWTAVEVGSASTTLRVEGLANGTAFVFRVAAVNEAGAGPVSATITVTPVAPATYGVTVAAVCVDDMPQAAFELDGSGAVIVTFADVSAQIQQERPTWQADWPSIDDGFIPEVPWSAVVAGESGTPVDSGTLTLPVDCSPSPTVDVPGAPASLSAVTGNGFVDLSWSAPADDGGAPVTGFAIEYSADGGGRWTSAGAGPTSTSLRVSGLTNGTRYAFRVLAVNVAGMGAASNVVNAVPRTVPGAPRSLTAVPGGSGQVRLAWVVPASSGGSAVTDYVVQRSANGSSGWVTVADGVSAGRSLTVSGLSNGTRYAFRVLAVNVAGMGAASNVVNAVPRTVPGAPRSLTAVPGGSGQVRLAWVVPASSGGSAVTDYVVQRSTNGSSGWVTVADGVSAGRSLTVSGLSNGTRYAFRVLAVNVAGMGAASNVVNAVPRTVPGAPRSLTAVPGGSGQVRLAWAVPASSGGSAVTDYVVQRSANGSSGWVTVADGVSAGRSFTVSGLTNGTRYYFRVLARNAAGTGAASNVVNAIPRRP